MFKILIPDFVAIELHICSIDERGKSVEMNAIIELTSFFGTKTIKMNSLWFEYSVLENFLFGSVIKSCLVGRIETFQNRINKISSVTGTGINY
jgi:hypothetical protein